MSITHELLEELAALVGREALALDGDELSRHGYDAWPLAVKLRAQGKAPYLPDVVVFAQDTAQVSRVLRWATSRRAPVTPWGAGSSVTGAPLALRGGIALDVSQMTRTLVLDEHNLMVKVQAGKMGHRLEEELNRRGYTLNHSPQSLDRSTVGGWVSTRATGQFSSRYGGIEDLLVALTGVLPTGEIVETKLAPRAAIGPDARQVFLGAEGTLGVVTEVTLKIFPLAPFRRLEALRFPDVESGVEAMRRMMRAGLRPFLVRFYDEDEARHAMRDPDFDGCAMFLGFEGLEPVGQAEYAAGMGMCRAAGGAALGPAAVEGWMGRRFDFSTVENLLAQPGGVAETIEVAHFWDGILETYRRLKAALSPLADEALGHFSHVYPQGSSLYVILLGKVQDDAAAEARIRQFWDVSMRICLETGAAISHHHGVGIARLPFLRDDLGSSALVLDRLKSALDPAGIMNPGKLGLG